MKTLRKCCCLLLCALMLTGLTGCESQAVKEAKELIDSIYENTNRVAQLETELRYFDDDSDAGQARKAGMEAELHLCRKLIDSSTRLLESLYGKMSEKERKIIRDYLNETYTNNILDIWS